MELWDLYTEERELIGRTHIRGEAIPEGCFHLVVHVWIRNNKGEYLISQRAADRPTFPLMWECVGGSVTKGEDSLMGALREAMEEVGVNLDPRQGKVLFTRTRRDFGDIMDVWLFNYNGPLRLEQATTDEVAQCAWMTPADILKLRDAGKLVETLDYFFTEVDQ